jgi:hypothetical protein
LELLAYHEVKGVGLQEYEWLRARGVTAQVAAFRLDSNQAGREITELNREDCVRQHNQVHAILENDKDASSPSRRDTIREGKKPAKPTSPTSSHRKAETSASFSSILLPSSPSSHPFSSQTCLICYSLLVFCLSSFVASFSSLKLPSYQMLSSILDRLQDWPVIDGRDTTQ